MTEPSSSLLQPTAPRADALDLIQENWREFLISLLHQFSQAPEITETPDIRQFNTLDAADTAELLQLDGKAPGDLALVLILRAARLSYAEIYADCRGLLSDPPTEDKPIAKLAQRLQLDATEQDLEFPQEAFLRPQTHPLFSAARRNLVDLLKKCGMAEAGAEAVGRRLPTAYFYALQREWFNQAAFYAPLLEVLTPENHFLARNHEEKRWNLYLAGLLKDVDDRMLDECFGIREIYVPPLAAIHTRQAEEGSFAGDYGDQHRPHVIDLGKEILRWAYVPERDDTVRLITGESGSGKTAFLTALAAKISGSRLFPDEHATRAGIGVLSVSLPDLPLQTSLRAALQNYGSSLGLPEKFLDPAQGSHRLLLILDGLDQMHTTDGPRKHVVHLLEQCDSLLAEWNSEEPRLQILASSNRLNSRDLPRRFQHPRGVIRLLPFYTSPDERSEFHDEDGLLLEDKRHVWWKNFQQARGLKPDGLPEALATPEYEELTRLPLENYLTALAWIDSDEPLEKRHDANTIYHHLLTRGYSSFQRRLQQAGRQTPSAGEYERFLQEIALEQWENQFAQGVSPSDLEERMRQRQMQPFFAQFAEAGGRELMPVFSALFFKQDPARQASVRAWRMYPRRFAEYLVARRLHQSALAMTELRGQQDALGTEEPWQRRALQHWSRATSPVAVTPRISQLLIREISTGTAETAGSLHATVTELFNYALRHGLELAGWQGRESSAAVVRQSRNAEEALLVLLNACALNTREVSQINWPSADTARAWLHRLQSAEEAPVPFGLKCLDYLDLSGCQLMGCDLIGASLRHSDLSGSGFRGANLAEADLSYANLNGADLCVSGMAATTLYNADLTQADLRGAVLRAANLRRANLDGADLKGAAMENANAGHATFGSADTEGVNLDAVDLNGSDIDPVNELPLPEES